MANIIIGISGSVAAVKCVGLIHELVLQGNKCVAIVTADGLNFVTVTALASMGADVYTDDMYQKDGHRYGSNYSYASIMAHINLAKWADLIVVVPATANTIAKLSYGFADNLLTSTILASNAPKAIVPAMNGQMWHNPITQDNLSRLQHFGFMQWGPIFGKQACGDIELGRMLEVTDILAHIRDVSAKIKSNGKVDIHTKINTKVDVNVQTNTSITAKSHNFNGVHIVITAGATLEPIDPVRYISNYSSGKMGYSIAEVASRLGAKVTLISGSQVTLPVPDGVDKFISIVTAEEMLSQVLVESKNADIFIGCSAVCDYKVLNPALQKIKKNKTAEPSTLTLELIENPDIITIIKQTYPHLFVVGFAAETQDMIEYATKKLQTKNLDMIIANDVSNGKVFGEDEAQVTIVAKTITPDVQTSTTKLLPKYQIAEIICDHIYSSFLKLGVCQAL